MSPTRRILRRRARRRRSNGNGGGLHLGRWAWVLAGLLALLVVGAVATAGGSLLYGKKKYDEFVINVAPPDELLATLPRGGARVYDRNGILLYEFVDEYGGLRRPVPLDEISEWVIRATIATEDANFYENNGLNVRGLARAGVENLSPFGGSDFFEGTGGSSITQQLAKNVYIPKEERAERTVERKLKEAAIALELTEKYTKDQILEWYLNSISYGGIYVGIEAAAEGYFGKQASELTLPEAALLAGIPASPVLYNPITNEAVALARQHEVLGLMVRHGIISEAEAARARSTELQFKVNRFDIEAPHFVLGRIADEISQRFGERALYEDGLEVVTTLDLSLQREAERILEEKISEFEESSDGHNGAFYAMDPKTGQILVYVGSRDYFREDIEGRNDNAISLNSPGSTLKPFTYMTAFMQGWSTGAGILDTPAKIIDPATGDFFEPRNPSGNFQGVISAGDALGNSLNIPAFKAILFAGVENTMAVYKQVGITTLDNPLGYGPALTLGGVDVKLEDMVIAFSVLANQGVMRGQDALDRYDPGERTLDAVALLRVTDADGTVLYDFDKPAERRVVGSNFAYLVTAILSDPETQCITFGCGTLNLPDRSSAQKTGTSEPYEDSREIGDTWAFGYTPDLVAGVWAGNADNSPMVNITSTLISWRSWQEFMIFANDHLQIPPSQFENPGGVESRELCWPSGMLPSEHCPDIARYTGLFAEEVLEGDEEDLVRLEDTWWQPVDIDTRTGLLATPETPAAFVSREVRLVLPEEEIAEWEDLEEWAAEADITRLLAPLESTTDAREYLFISSPDIADDVSGAVTIGGRATSPAFESYTVEWGRGSNPESWVLLHESTASVTAGVLANWDTTQLTDGTYTLQIRLADADRGELRFALPVTVKNGEAAAVADNAPIVEISEPETGDVVSGTVALQGIAFANGIREVNIDVGPGLRPAAWTSIRRDGRISVTGPLGSWDTTGLEDGLYTIRLMVRDSRGNIVETRVIVTVRNGQ
ncbi:MAG: transglycosylase domain-containing protein [Chloroflexi bacterium]|nr:transglycosylase domain-containing protein [Chloroflexota bacterium]